MNKLQLETDNKQAAMEAWNILTELLGGKPEDQYDDADRFSQFYSMVVSRLHELEDVDI